MKLNEKEKEIEHKTKSEFEDAVYKLKSQLEQNFDEKRRKN